MSGWSPTVTESLAKVWGPGQVGLGHRWSPEMAWAQGTFRQGSALAFSLSSVTLGIPRNFSEPPFAPLWNRNSFLASVDSEADQAGTGGLQALSL